MATSREPSISSNRITACSRAKPRPNLFLTWRLYPEYQLRTVTLGATNLCWKMVVFPFAFGFNQVLSPRLNPVLQHTFLEVVALMTGGGREKVGGGESGGK